MALLPRPVRRLLRRFNKPETKNPDAINPQLVGLRSTGSMLYLPTPLMIALIVFAAAVGTSQVMQALRVSDSRTQIAPPGTIGSLHMVFLPGNQVFIGTLESVDRGSVVLSDVFYFQTQAALSGTPATSAQPNTGRGAQLVRRMDNDWHQPSHMSIPIDKVMMLESVGRDSIVTRLITEARTRQTGAQP